MHITFAHKAKAECDPWYVGKMSPWHKEMQSHFAENKREIVIWNESHTEYHIADVVLDASDIKYVIEFQHSAISQNEFIARSEFYIKNGYKVMWVFDFLRCNPPKKVYIDTREHDNVIKLVWPGRDRIRFLDNIDFSYVINQLYISFHINTGEGELHLNNPDGDFSWETWRYKDPFSTRQCFLLLCLNSFETTHDFNAWYYSEPDFYYNLEHLDR